MLSWHEHINNNAARRPNLLKIFLCLGAFWHTESGLIIERTFWVDERVWKLRQKEAFLLCVCGLPHSLFFESEIIKYSNGFSEWMKGKKKLNTFRKCCTRIVRGISELCNLWSLYTQQTIKPGQPNVPLCTIYRERERERDAQTNKP